MVFLVSYNRKYVCLPFLIQGVKNSRTVVRFGKAVLRESFPPNSKDWCILITKLQSSSLNTSEIVSVLLSHSHPLWSDFTSISPSPVITIIWRWTAAICGTSFAWARNEYFSAATGCCRAIWRVTSERHGFQCSLWGEDGHLWDKKSQKSATFVRLFKAVALVMIEGITFFHSFLNKHSQSLCYICYV